jgi:predicted molibdopterin-dependent oxidoreductase YjgC
MNHAITKIDGTFQVEKRESIPYKNGFDTDDGEFVFLEEYDTRNYEDGELFLITAKSKKSLNSQFEVDEYVYINSSHNIEEGKRVELSSVSGSAVFCVKIDDALRDDCVLLYSGNTQLNTLTTSKHSFEGKCAIFQENRVTITLLDEEG